MAFNPDTKTFITTAQNTFGLDPSQTVDMNDPMTKLTMSVVLTNIEQGRNIYSYDQFIKGIAKSIGIPADEFDKNVNETQLGFENNSGSQGFVSPNTSAVINGGSSITKSSSTYYNPTFATGINLSVTTSVNVPGGELLTVGGVTTSTGQLAGFATATPFSGTQGSFYNTVYDKVLASAIAQGAPNPEVLARVGAAQAALETGYGAKAYDNNVFNITGSGDAGSVVRGDTNAAGTPITQTFARYSSLDSASNAYVKLMLTAPRYSGVVNASDTTTAIAALGRSGYAEDPNYANSVAIIVAKSNVTVSSTALGQPPTPPLGYENATITKNTDGSYTFTNADGTKTTIVTGSTFTAQRPPGWENATVTTTQDSNRNTIGYTLTRTNPDGSKSTLIQYNDGSQYGKLVDPKTGETYDPTKNVIVNNNGDIQTTNILPSTVKLTDAPSLTNAGVPSDSVAQISYIDGKFNSVTYTDPMGNVIKAIDKEGRVYDSNGVQTPSIYGGGSQPVAGDIPPEAVGLTAAYSKDVDFNSNGAITKITFKDPEGNVVRTVDPNNGIVYDQTGKSIGYVDSRQVTTEESIRRQLESGDVTNITGEPGPQAQTQTVYNFTSTSGPTITSATDRISGSGTTSSGQDAASVTGSTYPSSTDPALQQLRDRQNELSTQVETLGEQKTVLNQQIADQQAKLDDPNISPFEKDAIVAQQEKLLEERATIDQQLANKQVEGDLIGQKLANPEGFQPNARQQDELTQIYQQDDSAKTTIDLLDKPISNTATDPYIQDAQVVRPLVPEGYVQQPITTVPIYGIYPETPPRQGVYSDPWTGQERATDVIGYGTRTLESQLPEGVRAPTSVEMAQYSIDLKTIQEQRAALESRADELSFGDYTAQRGELLAQESALKQQYGFEIAGGQVVVRDPSLSFTDQNTGQSTITSPEPEVPGDLGRFVAAEEKYGTDPGPTPTIINDPSPTPGYDNGFEAAINPAYGVTEQPSIPSDTNTSLAGLPIFAGGTGGTTMTGVSSGDQTYASGFGIGGATSYTASSTTNVGGTEVSTPATTTTVASSGPTTTSGTSPAGGSTSPGASGNPAAAGAQGVGGKGC